MLYCTEKCIENILQECDVRDEFVCVLARYVILAFREPGRSVMVKAILGVSHTVLPLIGLDCSLVDLHRCLTHTCQTGMPHYSKHTLAAVCNPYLGTNHVEYIPSSQYKTIRQPFPNLIWVHTMFSIFPGLWSLTHFAWDSCIWTLSHALICKSHTFRRFRAL